MNMKVTIRKRLNSELKRTFVALHPTPKIRKEIENLILELSKMNNGIKWIRSDDSHLTLHFLGNLNQAQIEKVDSTIKRIIKGFGLVEFELKDLNAFPNLLYPQVLFLEVEQISGNSMLDLQKKIGEKIAEMNINIDSRPWQAHFTLGRVKDFQPITLIKPKFKEREFVVRSIVLMESVLNIEGSEYKTIKNYRL
ncbi:MAG: 2'-5' RNA ligase [Parcubacteria group bacterium GW2011_GWE2_38_18]|nr:MAG: 2'-5' RNA ligase [Parcubacteria group bacterium GW2011_GWE2_38_18]